MVGDWEDEGVAFFDLLGELEDPVYVKLVVLARNWLKVILTDQLEVPNVNQRILLLS